MNHHTVRAFWNVQTGSMYGSLNKLVKNWV